MRIISWLGVSCDLFEIIWEVLLLPLNLHLGRYQEATCLSSWAFGCLCDPLHFTELKALSKFFFSVCSSRILAELWIALSTSSLLLSQCHFHLILLLGYRTHKTLFLIMLSYCTAEPCFFSIWGLCCLACVLWFLMFWDDRNLKLDSITRVVSSLSTFTTYL